MKFYIASKLENAENVRRLAVVLVAAGWEHTYDWTAHGNVRGDGPVDLARVRLVGRAEARAVLLADVVIVLLPGGRGTHVEMGIAIGSDDCKALWLVSSDAAVFGGTEASSTFYHLNEEDGVHRLVEDDVDAIAAALLVTHGAA